MTRTQHLVHLRPLVIIGLPSLYEQLSSETGVTRLRDPTQPSPDTTRGTSRPTPSVVPRSFCLAAGSRSSWTEEDHGRITDVGYDFPSIGGLTSRGRVLPFEHYPQV